LFCLLVEAGERSQRFWLDPDGFELAGVERPHEDIDGRPGRGHPDDFDFALIRADESDRGVPEHEHGRVTAKLRRQRELGCRFDRCRIALWDLQMFTKCERNREQADGSFALKACAADKAGQLRGLEADACCGVVVEFDGCIERGCGDERRCIRS